MLETILMQHRDELVGAITRRSELGEGEARQLLPPALEEIGAALGAGRIDPASLLGEGGQGLGALLGRLDVGGIARAAGLDEARVRGGLTSLLPELIALLGKETGGAQALLGTLGGQGGRAGVLGALGGLAGRFLRR